MITQAECEDLGGTNGHVSIIKKKTNSNSNAPSLVDSDSTVSTFRCRGDNDDDCNKKNQCSLIDENSSESTEKDSYEGRYVRTNKRAPPKYYTAEEVAQHCTAEDCWVICDQKVYNVTSWIKRHPGGELVILSLGGQDITDPFLVNHLGWVRDKILPLYQIGYVKNYKPSEMSRDLCDLHLELEASGFYNTSYADYVKCCIWYSFLFMSSLGCIFFGRSAFIRAFISALFLAFYWQQIAFFGHDLGHMAVTHHRVIDNLIGIVGGNLMMGIALGWWKATHNVHHVVTNYLENDPDIQHLPVFAISEKFFQGIHSKYHQRRMEFDFLSRILVPFQHILFYPVMFLARFNLYLQSILLLVQTAKAKAYGIKWPLLELVMLSGFYVWLTQLLRCFPTYTEMIIFILVSHGVAGILHLQICLSHFSMDVLEPQYHGKPLEKIPFMEHQLKTSLDVDCPRWLDWFHGGLQFQATHHLFPMAPRHKLRQLMSTRVADLCKKHSIIYHKVSFWKGNSMILSTLKDTADKLHPWFPALVNSRG